MSALATALDRAPDHPDPRWEDEVLGAVRDLTASDRESRARVRGQMTQNRSWALVGWARDTASRAVRDRDRERVVLGLVGLSLFGRDFDPRDALLIYPLLGRAAEKLGQNRPEAFLEAASLSDAQGERWLTELSESGATPESMGFEEQESAEGFTFRNTQADWDPETELADLLDS